ncbi:Fc.00g099320.m01.CDS01 [Cosmosporella sp. VM-42]
MASTETDDGTSLSDQPFAWVLVPLVIFLFIGVVATIYQIRRRRHRRLQNQWPGQPITTPHGIVVITNRRPGPSRWAPWTTRSQEGLNELGEAPPPYDPKKERAQELRDLERGEAAPPEYPAVPGPAVTTETRRFA